MPFEIIRADITKLKVDAIVNAADEDLLGGGGVDGAIHQAAGKELLEECKTLGGCLTEQAKITKAYNLPAKYIIHTVGPIWLGGAFNEEQQLKACYQNSLDLAVKYKIKSIAFPLISSGLFAYPKELAIQTAMSVIGEFLLHHEMNIYIVVYDRLAYMISEKLFFSVQTFIEDNYIDENSPRYNSIFDDDRSSFKSMSRSFKSKTRMDFNSLDYNSLESKRNLDDLMEELQETFSESLLRRIDEKGKTDVEIYKKANIDRKLFSKIRSDRNYKPKKSTAIAFAIALELNLDETKDLLLKAGYALSHSNRFDLIIEYFIKEEQYDIYEINEALFTFDQLLLGV
ncbi:MAG: macro domain-containing protein [Firmicutes bacterium]|nr:macro domain-containing protein [Bacillota bacterium]